MAAAFVSATPLVELQLVSISPGQSRQPSRTSIQIHETRTETFHDSPREIVATGGCAAACYAATRKRQSHKAVRNAFENELWVQPPVGFFDPLGFTKGGDEASYKRRHETELKQGGVAVLAAMGYITPDFVRLPGVVGDKISFLSIPNGLAALGKVPADCWLQMFLSIGLMDTAWIPVVESRVPGDRARCGALGVPNGSRMPTGKARNQKLNAELAHGRLAMMAIRMVLQALLGEIGHCMLILPCEHVAPAWRPGQLTPDAGVGTSFVFFYLSIDFTTKRNMGYGFLNFHTPEITPAVTQGLEANMANFTRKTAKWIQNPWFLPMIFLFDEQDDSCLTTEMRAAMLAILGFLIPPWFFAFPEFQNVPPSLSTIGNNLDVGAGLGAVFLSASFFELNLLKQKEGSFPGDFGDPWKGASLSTRFELNDQRNTELNNGRLAMLAVICWSFNEYFCHLTPAEQVIDTLKHPEDIVLQFGLVGVIGAWAPFIDKPITEWPASKTRSQPKSGRTNKGCLNGDFNQPDRSDLLTPPVLPINYGTGER